MTISTSSSYTYGGSAYHSTPNDWGGMPITYYYSSPKKKRKETEAEGEGMASYKFMENMGDTERRIMKESMSGLKKSAKVSKEKPLSGIEKELKKLEKRSKNPFTIPLIKYLIDLNSARNMMGLKIFIVLPPVSGEDSKTDGDVFRNIGVSINTCQIKTTALVSLEYSKYDYVFLYHVLGWLPSMMDKANLIKRSLLALRNDKTYRAVMIMERDEKSLAEFAHVHSSKCKLQDGIYTFSNLSASKNKVYNTLTKVSKEEIEALAKFSGAKEVWDPKFAKKPKTKSSCVAASLVKY